MFPDTENYPHNVIHLTSGLQTIILWSYKDTFVSKENKNNNFIQQFFSSSRLHLCVTIVERVSRRIRLLLLHVNDGCACYVSSSTMRIHCLLYNRFNLESNLFSNFVYIYIYIYTGIYIYIYIYMYIYSIYSTKCKHLLYLNSFLN